MSNAPLMPKATAVWLVENTSLTFDQIADFCKLHPLEVKGIADGEVAAGIKGHDPITSGQLTREEIAKGEAGPEPPPQARRLQGPAARGQEGARAALHAAVAPPGPAERHPLAGAQPSRAEGCPDHAARRHDQDDPAGDPRPHPLELRQSHADGSGDARPLLADRSRHGGQSRRQGPPDRRGGSRPDAGPRRNHHRAEDDADHPGRSVRIEGRQARRKKKRSTSTASSRN